MTTAQHPNPFTNPAIAVEVDERDTDAVQAWRWYYDSFEMGPGMSEAGERLAHEVERLRTWVAVLEQEGHALRGLVERARELRPPITSRLAWGAWITDADRVLAGDTGDAE